MITESEARKRWCPFARDSLLEECRDGVTSYSFNRAVGCGAGELPENCLCVASDCMAWEWGLGDGKIETKDFETFREVNLRNGDCGLKRK